MESMLFGIFWVVCAVLTAVVAAIKKRNVGLWLMFAVLFAPLAMILILLLPSLSKEEKAGISNSPSADIRQQIAQLRGEFNSLNSRLYDLESRLTTAPQDSPAAAPILAKPTPAPEPATPKEDVEVDIGRFWLNKIGIIIFSLGIAFLLTYTFKHFGPFAKILFGYLVAGSLFFIATRLEKQEKFVAYGRVLLGGFWAIVYFVTYAMYH